MADNAPDTSGHARILAAIRNLGLRPRGFRMPEARETGATVLHMLQDSGLCRRLDFAGDLRRRCETVRGLVFVAVTDHPDHLLEYCARRPAVTSAARRDPDRLCLTLANAIPVDIRLVPDEAFVTALVAMTGCVDHVLALQRLASAQGLTLTADGLYRNGCREAVESEGELYAALGLACVPPELREGRGEIELALQDRLPRLVTRRDLRGVLHVHTTYSDGELDPREAALAAREMGFEYIGISDHSQSAHYAGGMSPRTVQAQHREIDTLNRELAPFHVFKGVECDILPDGSLDYDEPILASFDFVIASIHTRPNLPRDQMMKRLLAAVRNPYTTIIGHPTGRLLLTHQGLDVDPDELLAAAAAAGTALELNANPYRLDLDWRCLRRARELGVPIPICPDAHTRDGLADVEFGLSMARKGGLTAADVLTCWETDAVAAYLRRKRR